MGSWSDLVWMGYRSTHENKLNIRFARCNLTDIIESLIVPVVHLAVVVACLDVGWAGCWAELSYSDGCETKHRDLFTTAM